MYFCDFRGGGGPNPLSPSGSAPALHPPMSKSRANVLLIFQCPGICLTPVQVDIFVSDDSLAFCPTMYTCNGVFTWVETRAKSELRVRLVPLTCCVRARVRACVCVCVCEWWGGGGGQDVTTI